MKTIWPDKDNSISEIDDDDATDYPVPAFRPIHYNSESSDSEPEDNYYNRRAVLNSTDRPCCVSLAESPDKDDYNTERSENSAKNGENSLKSRENDYEGVKGCDYIKELGLINEDSDDYNDNEIHSYDEDETENCDEVVSGDCEDDHTVQGNSLVRFLQRSNVFIRNLLRRAFDHTPPTPRE